jgi:hypothetical protein
MARRRKLRYPRRAERTGGSTRHPNSLANLVPGGYVAPPGNDHALRHGYRSRLLVADVSEEIVELASLLAESAPVKDADGSLPVADTTAVELAAVALKRWRSVHTWCETHGRLTDDGSVKAAAQFELEGERALHHALDVLGMNPAARSRLGLNIARAASLDLATLMSDATEAADLARPATEVVDATSEGDDDADAR